MRHLLLLCFFVLPLAAQRMPERVDWCQSPKLLAGRHIDVRLLSDERVSGAWASVKEGMFTLVDKNGRSRTFARGQIRSVHASRHRVSRRLLGALAGFYGGAGAAAAATRSADGLQSAWGPVAVAATLGGYFVGRSFDRDTREITLLFSPGCD
jgi:hypothetical protein